MLQACSNINSDPLEPLNRRVFNFNADIADVLPMSSANEGGSDPADLMISGIKNVASNLNEPLNFANAILQGRECAAGVSLRRFLTNSTLGLGGLFDVAKAQGGLSEYNTGFGETLGLWGLPSGPYLIIPFTGPTNVRGVAGSAVEFLVDPVNLSAAKWSATADAVITGLQVTGDALSGEPQGTHERSPDTAGDAYLAAKQAFDAAQDASMAGYECPAALTSKFWAPRS